jgi:hypothetical protein
MDTGGNSVMARPDRAITLSIPLTLVARAMTPWVYKHSVRMPRETFNRSALKRLIPDGGSARGRERVDQLLEETPPAGRLLEASWRWMAQFSERLDLCLEVIDLISKMTSPNPVSTDQLVMRPGNSPDMLSQCIHFFVGGLIVPRLVRHSGPSIGSVSGYLRPAQIRVNGTS